MMHFVLFGDSIISKRDLAGGTIPCGYCTLSARRDLGETFQHLGVSLA